jgi:transcriptional regulator with XRE-family HTH domain
MKNNIGEYIKAERLRYKSGNSVGVSQFDLSLKIGWENPSTLSRIEQGKIIPNKDTVIKIFKALEIEGEKIVFILMKNLYLYGDLITPEYNNKVLNKFKVRLEDSIYPYIISLYPNNIEEINVYMNKIAGKVLFGEKFDSILQKKIPSQDVIDVLLNPQYGINERILNRDEFIRIVITNLHIIYSGDTDEEKEYIDKMRKLPNFDKYWEMSKNSNFDDLKMFNIPFVYDSPLLGEISLLIQKSVILEDNRFFMQEFIPKGKEDFIKLSKIMNK